MSCPDPDALANFASLAGDERAAIADHAALCDSCRAIVSNIMGMESTRGAGDAATMPASGPPPTSNDSPSKIDRYTIERRVGAGAMGVVFAAYDPELARPVAVKVLRVGGSPERMRREAQALAKLTHPNVVAVYDVGDHDGSTFVTMALVDGDNLRTWLQSHRSTEQIIDVIKQAARGVDAAHRVGIVHRDLKPDNIFVARNGDVLVGDFGLARSAGPASVPTADLRLLDSNELTRTGTLVGTPAYMAPEQLGGDASAASDQFALCVTAWEALYGSRPFTGKSLGDLERDMRRGPPEEPATRNVPSHVAKAIRRGLAADPSARHASVAALLAALSPRRRRWPYAVAALGIAGAATAAIALREDPQQAAIARCDALQGPAVSKTSIEKIAVPAFRTAVQSIAERYATEWTTFARASCVANAKRELSDPVYAATSRCLERRAATFAWALTWGAPETMLDVVEALEPIDTCRVGESAAPNAKLAEFQRELDQVVVLVRASPSTVKDLTPFITAAETLGDPSVLAEMHYVVALARDSQARDPEPDLRRAILSAEQARDDRIRTRASALLATVIARTGRIAEASTQRDLAASAVARSADSTTVIAVERANVAVAYARADPRAQLAALRKIEALQIERFGDLSMSLVNTRFSIASALQNARDPKAGEALELAVTTASRLSESPPLLVLEQALMQISSPAARVPLAEQVVAISRRDAPQLLPVQIQSLALDYEVAGYYQRALASALEGLALVDASSKLHSEFLEQAAAMSFELADRSDDKAMRARRLDEALAFIERLPPAVRDGEVVQSLRGRTLSLQGRFGDAMPFLTASLAAAERSDPPHPYRIAVRSFALAQVLWEIGGTRERERALALAAQAAKRFPEARAMYAADEANGAAVDRVDFHVARLEAWRKTHR